MPKHPHPVELALNIYDNLGEAAMLTYLLQAATNATRPAEGQPDTQYQLRNSGTILHQQNSYTFQWPTTSVTPDAASRPARIPPQDSPTVHLNVLPLLTNPDSESVWAKIYETVVEDAINTTPNCYLNPEEVQVDLIYQDTYPQSAALHHQVNQLVRNFEPTQWLAQMVETETDDIARKALSQLTPEQTRAIEQIAKQAVRDRMAQD